MLSSPDFHQKPLEHLHYTSKCLSIKYFLTTLGSQPFFEGWVPPWPQRKLLQSSRIKQMLCNQVSINPIKHVDCDENSWNKRELHLAAAQIQSSIIGERFLLSWLQHKEARTSFPLISNGHWPWVKDHDTVTGWACNLYMRGGGQFPII